MTRSQDGLADLIEALTILHRYAQPSSPTHCEHDVLQVMAPKEVTPEDADRLEQLGFQWSDSSDYQCWISFRFGSA